jgi:hypothetical protein
MLHLLLFLIWDFSLAQAQAREDDFQMRLSWVKTLNQFKFELEKKEKRTGILEKKVFLWSWIDQAWADSRYDCFYAGWPSVKRKGICTHPSETNSSYEKSTCLSSQFLCEPLSYGPKNCVPADNNILTACEKIRPNFEHLRTMSNVEISHLREMSLLAADLCEKEKTPVCEKVKDRLHSGLKAIDRALQAGLHQSSSENPAECNTTPQEYEKMALTVTRIAQQPMDSLYEKMKKEFESSPFCDPLKVLNNPDERVPGALMSAIMRDLKQLDFLGIQKEARENFLKNMSDKWQMTPSLTQEVFLLLNEMGPPGDDKVSSKRLITKAKGLILQDVINNFVPLESFSQIAREELTQMKVFRKNKAGQPECPFVSKDAFMKALSGKENLLKEHGKSITKQGRISIVDYTRPSNERRLFVLDLDRGIVLHNTTVAHGSGGGSETAGKDGAGSSPQMSNKPGSNKSSEGFIIAGAAGAGAKYGPNVVLRGVDLNNTNMQSRAVVLHGWESPLGSYSAGIELFNQITKKYDPPVDVSRTLLDTDFRDGNLHHMEAALSHLSAAISANPYLNSTEGCLGVPKTNVKHLDRLGRNKIQLELLREDLPGSIIFNYSGPQMRSKFF